MAEPREAGSLHSQLKRTDPRSLPGACAMIISNLLLPNEFVPLYRPELEQMLVGVSPVEAGHCLRVGLFPGRELKNHLELVHKLFGFFKCLVSPCRCIPTSGQTRTAAGSS